MSVVRVVIDYDTDANTACISTGSQDHTWHEANLTIAGGITETRDGYLVRLEQAGAASLLLTGMMT